MISITNTLFIDESEVQESFVRSAGPGGQNVNKVATTVQLRFNVAESPNLPNGVKERILRRYRLTDDGILIVSSSKHRKQVQNRKDAMDKLISIIREGTIKPKSRRATKPTRSSKKQRLDAKKKQGEKKQSRKAVSIHD